MKKIFVESFRAYRDTICASKPFDDISKTAKNVYGLISYILALPAMVFSLIAGICVYIRRAHLMNKFLKINF